MTTLDLSIPPWLSGAGASSSSSPLKLPETPEELAQHKRELAALHSERREFTFSAMFEPFMEAMVSGISPYTHFDRDSRIYEFVSHEQRNHKEVIKAFIGTYTTWIMRDKVRKERYYAARKMMNEVMLLNMVDDATNAESELVGVDLLAHRFKVMRYVMTVDDPDRYAETKKNIVENVVDIAASIARGRERALNRPELKLVSGVTIENGGE